MIMHVFDAHCDLLWKMAENKPSCLTAEALAAADVRLLTAAIFEGNPTDRAIIKKQMKLAESITRVGDCRIVPAFEGLSWVKSRKDTEVILNHRPVYVGPVWNHANFFGGSCHEDAPLTPFGRCFLDEIAQSGAAIDLAHAGEAMMVSCMEQPWRLIFSHGNVFEVCPHPRNLKKKMIRALAERNGFFGISLYAGFVGDTSVETLFRHIEAVLEAGGEKILGFGSDLDGCTEVVGGNGTAVFPEIYEEMKKRNYPDALIRGIFYGNWERILSETAKSR